MEGIKHTLPANMTHSWQGMAHANTNPLGVEWFGLVMGLGFVSSFGYWCTDFLVVQRAMAADSDDSARKAPLIAAVPKMFLPFLVILPGMIAVSIATHTSGLANGANPAVASSYVNAEGKPLPLDEAHPHGIIPVKIDAITGKDVVDSNGAWSTTTLAIPVMLLTYFPTGMLGLGLTALLASFMSGMAGNVTAFNTVWTYDIYQAYIHKDATDAHYLWMGRSPPSGGSSCRLARPTSPPASTTSWTCSNWSSPSSTRRCSPPSCWACSGSGPPATAPSPAWSPAPPARSSTTA